MAQWNLKPFISIIQDGKKVGNENTYLMVRNILKELIFEPATEITNKCYMICPHCHIKGSWCGTYYPDKEEEKLHIDRNVRCLSTVKHLPIVFKKR